MAPRTDRPEVIPLPGGFRARCDEARERGRRVGFVPTMGALHEGHLALVHEARRRVGDEGFVAVSIFVNPTQFGPTEDLARYPRTFEADLARCGEAGVDAVFAPEPSGMYPPGDETRVRVSSLAGPMCGVFRPVHFEGVATVVTKLLALAGPCVAVFGRKDYQQWRVIERLVTDLFLPVEVVGVATVRERDGLALSSRNRYLSPADRARALAIPRSLGDAVRAFARGERSTEALREGVASALRASLDRVDYVELRDSRSLAELPSTLSDDARAVLAVAGHVGTTRLIDNVVLGQDPPPA